MYSKRMQNKGGQPKKISQLLSTFLKDEEVKQKSDSVDFFKHWDQIVGSEFSKFCKPVRLNKGVLFVEAIDAAYMQELSLQQKIFKKRITELGFGGADITNKISIWQSKKFK